MILCHLFDWLTNAFPFWKRRLWLHFNVFNPSHVLFWWAIFRLWFTPVYSYTIVQALLQTQPHNTVLKTTEWSNSATYRGRAFAVRSWSFPCWFVNGKLLSDHVVIFIFFVYIVYVSQGGFHVGRAPRVENRENYIIYYDDKPNVFWHVILITSLTSPHFVRGI